MTVTDSELELIEYLDFSIECQIKSCSKDATWTVVTKCCKTSAAICDEHKAKLLDKTERYLNASRMSVICKDCDKPFHSVEEWLEFLPLGT